MTLQTGLIILSIVFFIWDAFNTRFTVKLSSLGWAALILSYLAGQFG